MYKHCPFIHHNNMNQFLTNAITPIILLSLGALLSIGGTVIAMHQQTLSEKSLREKTEKIINVATSGDAFPWAEIGPTIKEDNVLMWIVANNSKEYPLYDVHLTLIDTIKQTEILKKNKEEGLPTFTNNDQYKRDYNFGTMGPEKAINPPSIIMPEGSTYYNFILYFTHRYGSVRQYYKAKKIGDDGRWAIQYRVEELNGNILEDKNQPLKEKIDPTFKKNGQ